MQSAIKLDSSSINLEQMTREVVRRLLEASNGHGVTQEIQRRNGLLELQVPIGVSVRHVHLCPEHVRILFGEGYDLHIYNELYQKGYYAAKEQVMVVGRKRCIEKIRVLGPTRVYSQVELAQSDALVVGLKLPVATEGADPGTQPVTIVGPEGSINLTGGPGGGAGRSAGGFRPAGGSLALLGDAGGLRRGPALSDRAGELSGHRRGTGAARLDRV